MTQRTGHACDTLPFCILYRLIIISNVRSSNYCVLQCQIYSSYFLTNTIYGSHVFYKKLIVVYLLKKITVFGNGTFITVFTKSSR